MLYVCICVHIFIYICIYTCIHTYTYIGVPYHNTYITGTAAQKIDARLDAIYCDFCTPGHVFMNWAS